MKRKVWYHGAVVFWDAPEGAIDRFSRIIAATLEDHGHPINRRRTLSETQARIVTARYVVKLSRGPAPDDNTLQRAVISLSPFAPEAEDDEITELLLVVMLYRMVDACRAHRVEWLDPDMTLTVDQFLGTFAGAPARRAPGPQQSISPKAGRFGPVDPMAKDLSEQADVILGAPPHPHEAGLVPRPEEQKLALSFRDAGPAHGLASRAAKTAATNDVQRLASWGMTGMLVFLSGPVAASMAAVNLIRGEDFRLNTQVLSLTGCIVSLCNSGLLADAMAVLMA